MDRDLFDLWTRNLVLRGGSRRGVLRGLISGLIGFSTVALSLGEAEADRKRKGKPKEKRKPKKKRKPTRVDNGHQTGPRDSTVLSADDCQCVTYLQARGIISCCELHAKNFGGHFEETGERRLLGRSETPRAGDVMILQPGTWGAYSQVPGEREVSGHIALVTGARHLTSDRWNITVEHGNWSEGKIIPGAGPCPDARESTFKDRPLPANGVAFYRRDTSGPTRLKIEAAVVDPANNRSIFGPTGRAPAYSTIAAEVQLTGTNNQPVTFAVQMTYDGPSDAYLGTLDLGPQVPNGPYLVAIKFRDRIRTLRRQVSGFVNIERGVTTPLPRMSLTPGDVDDNNVLNIIDYNILLACIQGQPSCDDDARRGSDVDGNGRVDYDDYNLFLRAFGNHGGVQSAGRTRKGSIGTNRMTSDRRAQSIARKRR